MCGIHVQHESGVHTHQPGAAAAALLLSCGAQCPLSVAMRCGPRSVEVELQLWGMGLGSGTCWDGLALMLSEGPCRAPKKQAGRSAPRTAVV